MTGRVRRSVRLLAVSTMATALFWMAAPAWADPTGRIQQVESDPGSITFVLSAQGLSEGQSIDPDSVTVTVDGLPATTKATPITQAVTAPTRTAMLTLDTSGSMADKDKLTTAKSAANAYLEGLPADVRAGLITFADSAKVVVQPTPDRAKVSHAIEGLQAQGATALNDAVVLAVDALGSKGSRSIVLLSDGADEGSKASEKTALNVLGGSGIVLDSVSLGSGSQEDTLAKFAKAGNGTTVTATDADQLTAAFESAARTVDNQLAVSVTVPDDVAPGTAQLSVEAMVGAVPISDTTAALVVSQAPPPDSEASGPVPVQVQDGLFAQAWFLSVVIVLVFLGLAVTASLAVGVLDAKNAKAGRVTRRLDEVTVSGAPNASTPAAAPETVLGEGVTVRLVVSLAERVAPRRQSSTLGHKLESANVSLRPSEWIVVHCLITVLAGLLVTLLSGFNPLVTLLAVLLGLAAPWAYLSHLASKRKKRFYEQLPDAMQMLAGTLSTGYALPQALDSVARETGGPLAEELNRALLESRLGMPLEDTLDAVAQRMESKDFHWVVIAVRTNRRIGGNLSEVLSNVSKTLRDRERLRRQVKALSAEGVMSAWILGLLPLVVLLFVTATRPEYLVPLLTTPAGWTMVAIGLVLYVIGVIWLRHLVTMEV